MIRLLRPFHRNLKTELRKNPKVFFLDTGLRNYAVSDFNKLDIRSDRGMLAENVVYNSLLNITKQFERLNYWRTLSKAEVDFVITLSKETVPVEVKFSAIREPKVTRILRSFIDAYNPGRAIVATKDFWGETKIGHTLIKFIPACYL